MRTDLYLEQIRDMATIRWATVLPDNNIAMAFFPPRFPLRNSLRFPSNRRAAFSKAGGMKPKMCDSTSFTSVMRVLPIDDIARRARLIFKKWPVPRKRKIWSPPSGEECTYYDDPIKTVRETIYEKWKLRNYPDYYGYRPPFRTCWRFMTSRKFTATRIHEMRAGRSYLKAQKDWRDPDGSPLCPRCEEEEESFEHVITVCPALAETRERYSEFSFDISPGSSVWKENKK